MAYQVLARKWRPRNFKEMVGQEHVQRALINALDTDRLHHAFLFTGTRGVGKTTIARILAKSLNCELGVSSEPCGDCQACREIDEGRFIDLIEVDAASSTKAEDTRELMSNVQYAPSRGRYKVYLIDEVHMLSMHSFNALLKTLEEPPPHVKFLLATTDPQKLPLTVLSRCLQFNLKRLPVALISGHLAHVLAAEGVEYEDSALKLIALSAEGSMRDALSLLDQAIGHGGGRVVEAEVRAMLGTMDRGKLHELLAALADGDAERMISILQSMLVQAADPLDILDGMVSALQRIAMLQIVPGAAGDGDEPLVALAGHMSPEDTQLAYQIALQGKRDLPLAPETGAGLEMVLLRMLAFIPAGHPAGPVTARKRPPRVEPGPTAAGDDDDWTRTVESLGLRGAARQFALHCAFQRKAGNVVHLTLDATYEQLRSESSEARLRSALSTHFGTDIRLHVHAADAGVVTPAQVLEREAGDRQARAGDALAEDPNIASLKEAFGASFDPDAVRPVEPT